MRLRLTASFLTLALCFSAVAGDWPHWRGPDYDGSSPETGLPVKWSTTENVAWKAPMPGSGATTPIIVGENVFVASNDKEADKVVAICLNRTDGKVRWSHEIGPGKPFPRNTMVACSPTSDGKRVFFMFSDGTLAGFEVGGKPLWKLRIHEHADMAIQFGYTSSPLLVGDRLIVQVLQNPKQIYRHFKHNPGAKRESFLMALDPATGKQVWREVRDVDAIWESFEAYTSPLLWQDGGKAVCLVLGGDYLTAHDPLAGKELWRWGNLNPDKVKIWRQVASLTAGKDVICVPMPRGLSTIGVRPGGGTLQSSPPVWRHEDVNPDVCCAAYYRDRFYVLDGDKRILNCVEAKTGRKVWAGALSDQGIIRASPIAADGRIYTIAERGEVVIADAGDQFKILERIQMGEPLCQGSIAIAHGQLFIRTGQHVYCIGKR